MEKPPLHHIKTAILNNQKLTTMASYVTRVELYGSPAEGVYGKLHIAMKANGFGRSFLDKGKRFDLPHAMYLLSDGFSTIRTVELARAAASTVWVDFAVLVTETTTRFEYHNLRETK